MLRLPEIAERINDRSAGYRMGGFQSLRKELKGLSGVSTSKIFTKQTIHDEWAFHWGGRRELQFNIGFERIGEDQFFRHGVAYSLEPSRTLPNIDVLLRSIVRFNDYIRETASEFADFQMWDFSPERSKNNYAIREIPPELVKPGNFIFLGKLSNLAGLLEVNVDEVLRDFDRLLNLYEYAEGDIKTIRTIAPELDFGFQFPSTYSPRCSVAVADYPERHINIILRHNDIQYDLLQHLRSIHGVSNVYPEVLVSGGKKIDIVLSCDGSYTFYEIKTSTCLKSCIREALSQLMEYSYWPDSARANKMIIVTENESTDEAKKYLKQLRDRFGLPIYHQRFDPQRRELAEIW